MKKRTIAILALTIMAFAIPVCAATPRAINIMPDIVFDGNEATCTAQIAGDRVTDSISATMTLKQGNRVIDTWSGSGLGILSLRGTADVSRWVTYTLVVEATVNGNTMAPLTIQRTNN